MTQVSRDPFARTSLHRFSVAYGPNQTCSWCGNVRTTNPRLYRYETHHDGGRAYPVKGVFCSISCMRSYHN